MISSHLLCLLLIFPFMPQEVFTVDTNESTIRWTGKKIFGSHYGKIPIREGELTMEGEQLRSGSFTMNVRDMTNEDLEGDRRQDLLNWLRSEEMFYTEKYPEAGFKITSARNTEGEQYQIEGVLTIKGVSHTVSFPATVRKEGDKIRANASLTFDRTRWNLNYGDGGIIGGIGNSAIKDEVDVRIELVASASDV